MYVTYVSGFDLTQIVAVEWSDPKAHIKPTENSIAKYSDTINIGRQNDANLKYLWTRRSHVMNGVCRI